jgi:hypothetical protein
MNLFMENGECRVDERDSYHTNKVLAKLREAFSLVKSLLQNCNGKNRS